VLKDLEPIIDRVVVISFDKDAVGLVRDRASARIGWVIDASSDVVRAQAERLAPDYLFCDRPLLPDTPWPGPWQWVVYGVETHQIAAEVTARGVKIIETMSVGELLGG
jgi:glycerophosphoryl diester phosphodiesterase